MKGLIKKFKSKVRAIGKETHIRLFPNPGFAIVVKGHEIRWNVFYGWKIGKIRR